MSTARTWQKKLSRSLLLGFALAFSFELAFSSPAYAIGYNLGAFWRKAATVVSSLVSASWLGGTVAAQTAWSSGGVATGASVDGTFATPEKIAVDATNGYLYVVDSGNNRITKHTLSTGAFAGWIGAIGSIPTGGATGCKTATAGSFTPGWCTGGTATSGSGNGMLTNPNGIFIDVSGNILYVSDGGNNRISKYTASTGAFLGWIGKISTSPTGGATGCSGATVGTFTPGWCTGGASVNGTGDGMLNTPNGIFVDTTNSYLYVADSGNQRISKYNSSTGAFVGWLGDVGTKPTGGSSSNCHTTAAGSFTPGWCTGGAAQFGSGDGMLNGPSSVFVDVSGGNLYVTDTTNNRMSKYNAGTAAFLGWIGKINTSPTGGAAGCNGATVGTFTPGWCTGGTATSGTGNGMLDSPDSLVVDTTNNVLYVTDANNGRVQKYTASTGAFLGWIGKINTSPTGGAAGCNGATVGTFTPGWCTGGASAYGSGDGMLMAPHGIALDSGSGNLFVADRGNGRINKYTASTAAFVGWIGGLQSYTAAWVTSGTSVSSSGDGGLTFPEGIAVDSINSYIYVADNGNSRIMKYNLTSGIFVGWIGKVNTTPTGGAAGCAGATVGTFTPGWCTGGTAIGGSGDGMLNSPQLLTLDTVNGYLYVADSLNSRISKYNASTGAFLGWIGAINTSPTGGSAGCNGKAAGTATPGWCTGGTSTSGSGDGMFYQPQGVTVDTTNNYLYVGDNNYRISKFNTSTGAFLGWIGGITTSPTGGAAGCNGAAVGTVTPGWCTGGSSAGMPGLADGTFNTPYGVVIDPAHDALYVADSNSERVSKVTASTGAFVGWIGNILNSPTGGASGCSGAAPGTATPGWCKGGQANNGTGDGMYSTPEGLSLDSQGKWLYVTDHINSRVVKIDASTGAFSGWIGGVGSTPTGGAAGCTSAAVGSFTPGWCTGGTSTYGTGNGMMNYAGGLAMDSTYLYSIDYNNSRINRYTK